MPAYSPCTQSYPQCITCLSEHTITKYATQSSYSIHPPSCYISQRIQCHNKPTVVVCAHTQLVQHEAGHHGQHLKPRGRLSAQRLPPVTLRARMNRMNHIHGSTHKHMLCCAQLGAEVDVHGNGNGAMQVGRISCMLVCRCLCLRPCAGAVPFAFHLAPTSRAEGLGF